MLSWSIIDCQCLRACCALVLGRKCPISGGEPPGNGVRVVRSGLHFEWGESHFYIRGGVSKSSIVADHLHCSTFTFPRTMFRACFRVAIWFLHQCFSGWISFHMLTRRNSDLHECFTLLISAKASLRIQYNDSRYCTQERI